MNPPALRSLGLRAAILALAFTVAITEGLSLFGQLNCAGVAAAWLAGAGAGAVWLWRRNRWPAWSARPGPAYDAVEWMMAAALVLIGGGTLLTAVLAAPNNYDSMTYHLPRVMHWVQNGSVAHYPTRIDRQITQNPGAEFLLTQVYLLTGSDRWLNLVQWGCMLGSVAGGSWIARLLGAGRKGQLGAAVAVATLPVGILQASSTQNDYVVTLTLVALVAFTLEGRPQRGSLADAVWIGVSAGLVLLAKGTAYIFLPPVLGWWAWSARRRLWPAAALVVAAAIAINAGHWWRNQAVFGSPIGPWYGMRNERLGLQPLVANLGRNAALHLRTPSLALNRKFEAGVRWAYARLGWDLDDPALTLGSGFPFELSDRYHRCTHEDYSANFGHLLVLVLGLAAMPVWRRLRWTRSQWAYAAVVAAMALLFCGVLRWQIWGTRLHLPVFVLAAPLLGIWVEKLPRWAGGVLVAGLALYGGFFVAQNDSHRLVGPPPNVFRTPRIEQYFFNRPQLQAPLIEVARLLTERHIQRIGLRLEGNSWEYPLWRLTAGIAGRELEHVQVPDPIGRLAYPQHPAGFTPQAVVAIETPVAAQREFVLGSRTFRAIFHEGEVALFVSD